MTKMNNNNTIQPVNDDAEAAIVAPPALASSMVVFSLSKKQKREGLEAFHDLFCDECRARDDISDARNWAYRYGWRKLSHTYKPFIDIGMIIVAIVGFLIAIISIFVG